MSEGKGAKNSGKQYTAIETTAVGKWALAPHQNLVVVSLKQTETL